MHKVADWTSLHSTTLMEVQDVLQAFSANALISSPTHWPFNSKPVEATIDQTDFLNTKLVPAVNKALGIGTDLKNVSVMKLFESREERPHALFSEKEQCASIYLDWNGTPDDAICLAHEMGHAAHYIMSGVSDMPPVARETCAFLGELIVLDALFENQDPLFDSLQRTWEAENQAYLGSDIEDLQRALGDPEASYIYRWNYPLARLAAIEMFQSYKSGKLSLIEAFESGSACMSFVPLEQMAAKADEIQNYFSPFRTDTAPASAAYQSLGAMALLDIDTYEGPSERKIGDVYADLLKNLQDQTAFIGLREDGRPIGYATWQPEPDGNGLRITHQSSPFGDHLKLLRTLKQRFAHAEPVSAIAERSARKEQVAW